MESTTRLSVLVVFMAATALQSQAPVPPGAPVSELDIQKLREFITSQWKEVARIPFPKTDWKALISLKLTGNLDDYHVVYLAGVNRRNLASDTLGSASRFIDRGDIDLARAYAAKATRFYIDSNTLFVLADQVHAGSVIGVAEAFARMYEAAKLLAIGLGRAACGFTCGEVIDYLSLLTDFAVDHSMRGTEEAIRKLASSTFAKTLIRTTELSSYLEGTSTRWMRSSGLQDRLSSLLQSSEFEKRFAEALSEAPGMATKEVAERTAKRIIRSALDLVENPSPVFPSAIPDPPERSPSPSEPPSPQPAPPSPPGAPPAPTRLARLPEFHGAYAIDGDRLTELKEDQQQLADVRGDAQFILYDPTVQQFALLMGKLEIRRLSFVRNRVIGKGWDLEDTTVFRTLEKPNVQPLNRWVHVATRIDRATIELRTKPVEGRSDMIQAVPVSHLPPGVYEFGLTKGQGRFSVAFAQVSAGLRDGSVASYDEFFPNVFAVGLGEGEYRRTSFLDGQLGRTGGSAPPSPPSTVGSSVPTVSADFLGTWEGRIRKKLLLSTSEYGVRVNLKGFSSTGSECGRIEFLDDKCAGPLILSEVKDAQICKLQVTITEKPGLLGGLGAGLREGTAAIQLISRDELEWRAFDRNGIDGGTGSLRRVGGRLATPGSPTSPPQAPGAAPVGTWEGTVEQGTGPLKSRYPVQITFRQLSTVGKEAAAVEYPSFDCKGTLTLSAVEHGSVFILLEMITNGRCEAGGKVRIALSRPDEVSWEWFYPDGKSGAKAQLRPK